MASQSDTPSFNLDDPIWCDSCKRLKEEVHRLQEEHSLNYKTLKQKIISTDLLIRKYQTKCEEYDAQSKRLEEISRKLEKAERDSEVLTHQLSLSLEETEPLKKAKADLESVVIQKNTNIQTLQDQLQASESLCRQYEAFRKNSLDFDSERKSTLKKLQQLETSNKKLEQTITTLRNEIRTCKFESTKSNNVIKSLELKLQKSVGKLEVYWDILKENGLVPKGDKRPTQASIVDVDNPYEGLFKRASKGRSRSRVIDIEEDSVQEVPVRFKRNEKSVRQNSCSSSDSPPLNPTQEEGTRTLAEECKKYAVESPIPDDLSSSSSDDADDFDAVSVSSEQSFKFTMSPLVSLLSPLPPSPAFLQNANKETSSEDENEDEEIVTAFDNDYSSDKQNYNVSTSEVDLCDHSRFTPIKTVPHNETTNEKRINTAHTNFKPQVDREFCAKTHLGSGNGDVNGNPDFDLSGAIVNKTENISKSSTVEKEVPVSEICKDSSNNNTPSTVSETTNKNSNINVLQNGIGFVNPDSDYKENNRSSRRPDIDGASSLFLSSNTCTDNLSTGESENKFPSKCINSGKEVKQSSQKKLDLEKKVTECEKNKEANCSLKHRPEGKDEQDSFHNKNFVSSDRLSRGDASPIENSNECGQGSIIENRNNDPSEITSIMSAESGELPQYKVKERLNDPQDLCPDTDHSENKNTKHSSLNFVSLEERQKGHVVDLENKTRVDSEQSTEAKVTNFADVVSESKPTETGLTSENESLKSNVASETVSIKSDVTKRTKIDLVAKSDKENIESDSQISIGKVFELKNSSSDEEIVSPVKRNAGCVIQSDSSEDLDAVTKPVHTVKRRKSVKQKTRERGFSRQEFKRNSSMSFDVDHLAKYQAKFESITLSQDASDSEDELPLAKVVSKIRTSPRIKNSRRSDTVTNSLNNSKISDDTNLEDKKADENNAETKSSFSDDLKKVDSNNGCIESSIVTLNKDSLKDIQQSCGPSTSVKKQREARKGPKLGMQNRVVSAEFCDTTSDSEDNAESVDTKHIKPEEHSLIEETKHEAVSNEFTENDSILVDSDVAFRKADSSSPNGIERNPKTRRSSSQHNIMNNSIVTRKQLHSKSTQGRASKMASRNSSMINIREPDKMIPSEITDNDPCERTDLNNKKTCSLSDSSDQSPSKLSDTKETKSINSSSRSPSEGACVTPVRRNSRTVDLWQSGRKQPKSGRSTSLSCDSDSESVRGLSVMQTRRCTRSQSKQALKKPSETEETENGKGPGLEVTADCDMDTLVKIGASSVGISRTNTTKTSSCIGHMFIKENIEKRIENSKHDHCLLVNRGGDVCSDVNTGGEFRIDSKSEKSNSIKKTIGDSTNENGCFNTEMNQMNEIKNGENAEMEINRDDIINDHSSITEKTDTSVELATDDGENRDNTLMAVNTNETLKDEIANVKTIDGALVLKTNGSCIPVSEELDLKSDAGYNSKSSQKEHIENDQTLSNSVIDHQKESVNELELSEKSNVDSSSEIKSKGVVSLTHDSSSAFRAVQSGERLSPSIQNSITAKNYSGENNKMISVFKECSSDIFPSSNDNKQIGGLDGCQLNRDEVSEKSLEILNVSTKPEYISKEINGHKSKPNESLETKDHQSGAISVNAKAQKIKKAYSLSFIQSASEKLSDAVVKDDKPEGDRNKGRFSENVAQDSQNSSNVDFDKTGIVKEQDCQNSSNVDFDKTGVVKEQDSQNSSNVDFVKTGIVKEQDSQNSSNVVFDKTGVVKEQDSQNSSNVVLVKTGIVKESDLVTNVNDETIKTSLTVDACNASDCDSLRMDASAGVEKQTERLSDPSHAGSSDSRDTTESRLSTKSRDGTESASTVSKDTTECKESVEFGNNESRESSLSSSTLGLKHSQDEDRQPRKVRIETQMSFGFWASNGEQDGERQTAAEEKRNILEFIPELEREDSKDADSVVDSLEDSLPPPFLRKQDNGCDRLQSQGSVCGNSSEVGDTELSSILDLIQSELRASASSPVHVELFEVIDPLSPLPVSPVHDIDYSNTTQIVDSCAKETACKKKCKKKKKRSQLALKPHNKPDVLHQVTRETVNKQERFKSEVSKREMCKSDIVKQESARPQSPNPEDLTPLTCGMKRTRVAHQPKRDAAVHKLPRFASEAPPDAVAVRPHAAGIKSQDRRMSGVKANDELTMERVGQAVGIKSQNRRMSEVKADDDLTMERSGQAVGIKSQDRRTSGVNADDELTMEKSGQSAGIKSQNRRTSGVDADSEEATMNRSGLAGRASGFKPARQRLRTNSGTEQIESKGVKRKLAHSNSTVPAKIQKTEKSSTTPKTETSKTEYDAQLQTCLNSASVSADDFITEISQNRPALDVWKGLVDAVVKYLRNITVNTHSEVYTACTANRAETWVPVLTREEKKILTIVRQFLKVNQEAPRSLLMQALWKMVFAPEKEANKLYGKQALCRMFVALCQEEGDLEEARVLLFYIITCRHLSFPCICLSVVAVWPLTLFKARQDASPVVLVIEYIIMKSLEGDSTRNKSKQISECFCKLCDWSNIPRASEDILRQAMEKMDNAAVLNQTAKVFEVMKSIELLLVYEGWAWVYKNFILKHFMSTHDRWKNRAEEGLSPLYVQSVLKIIGDIFQLNVKPELKDVGKLVEKWLVTFLNRKTAVAAVPLCAAAVVLEVSPYQPLKAVRTLASWAETHTHIVTAELARSMSQARRLYAARIPGFTASLPDSLTTT